MPLQDNRRGRGGRQRSLGLGSARDGLSGPASSSPNIGSSIPKTPSSKGKEIIDSSQEPLADEIVPSDLSFGG